MNIQTLSIGYLVLCVYSYTLTFKTKWIHEDGVKYVLFLSACLGTLAFMGFVTTWEAHHHLASGAYILLVAGVLLLTGFSFLYVPKLFLRPIERDYICHWTIYAGGISLFLGFALSIVKT
jgi:hypothetical protein